MVSLIAPFVFLAASSPAWEQGNGFRWAALNVPPSGKTGFTLLPPLQTGILWTNVITDEMVAKHYNMVSGGGVAAGDFDGDGLCDLYFGNRGGTNGLFRNLGNWKFENATTRLEVGCAGQSSTGVTFSDVNGDGALDLLVNSFFGTNSCFLNLGNGRFANATQSAGLITRGGGTSLALGDLDGDGDLDLYAAYFGFEAILREGARVSFTTVNGKPVITGRHARRLKIVDGKMVELGEQDVLYLNDGSGHFTAAKWADLFRDEEGQPIAAAPLDFGLAAQIRDINEDGFPDIYVCNDFQTPDRVWLNDGRGHFRAIPRLALRNMSYASMGVDFADIDRDGRLDFFTVDMLSRDPSRRLRQLSSMPSAARQIGVIDDRENVPRNALYWNRGDGTYAEIAWFSGVAASDWSWTPIFLDVDLDGFEDLLVSAGSLYDVMDRDSASASGSSDTRKQLSLYPSLETQNAAFRNRGDLTFEDVGVAWGFDSRQVSHGMALADLDGDGDMDVVVNCANSAPLIYRNNSPAPRVAVRLKGRTPNTQGIGAKIKLIGGPVPMQSQEMICGGRYLSGDQAMRVFAAGASTNLTIEVLWRSGQKSLLNGVRPNCIYEIDEAFARDAATAKPPEVAPIFEDVSELLGHIHHETPYDDFARQPNLPRLLSQSGPGVAWFDWNGDGFDDLVLGAGRGGTLAVFQNDGKGAFKRSSEAMFNLKLPDDLGQIVGLRADSEKRSLFAALGNYEAFSNNIPSFLRFDFSDSGTNFPATQFSSGPLALGDVDGDGRLDLFVGGRVSPGRYPEPASSRLYRNVAGQFALDEDHSRAFENVGLVNGAVFSDLNGDGRTDLILACEWGAVRIFINEGGNLKEVTEKLGVAKYLGWWNGVTTGDFDGDGRMDIVASNWGRNTPPGGRLLYYGDIDGNGSLDLVEAHLDPSGRAVPEISLGALSRGIPSLATRIQSNKAYSEASLQTLFGERLNSAKKLEVNWLESTLFLNRGDHFDPRPLPREAQFAPAFGISVGDFDGDGNEDVFLAQNFFATGPEAERYDAGRGLWLKGDGAGNFKAVSGQESGVQVYGEQRGCALADYDHDGRVDLVVMQNGAATKLFHNTGGNPGYRVRLKGSEANPDVIGASLRLLFGEKPGPVREIQAGSGYWSQNSVVQVMGAPEAPTRIWVRWPGGKTVTRDLSPSTREIEISEKE